MKKNNVHKILEQFLQDMESSNKSRNTIVNYKSDLQNFLNNCPENIDNITVEILRTHFKGLDSKSTTTKARHTSSLKTFLNWCYRKDFIADNPIFKIDTEKNKNTTFQKRIDKDEIEKVIQSIDIKNICGTINKNNLKYRLIFSLMLEAGLKVYEVLNLECNDIETDTLTIFISGEPKRRIPLFSADCIELFEIFKKEMNIETGLIFQSTNQKDKSLSYQAVNKFWRKCCTNTDSKIKLQQLRDCYAGELIKKGIDISIVSKMLGHKNIQTTIKYL